MVRLMARVAVSLALVLAAGPMTHAGQPARYDLLIAGGTVIDGTGRAGVVTDVAIKAGKIAAIGRIPRSQAEHIIEASGLVVTPG